MKSLHKSKKNSNFAEYFAKLIIEVVLYNKTDYHE